MSSYDSAHHPGVILLGGFSGLGGGPFYGTDIRRWRPGPRDRHPFDLDFARQDLSEPELAARWLPPEPRMRYNDNPVTANDSDQTRNLQDGTVGMLMCAQYRELLRMAGEQPPR